ncbi:MAG: hypothetical protein IPO05_10320 [Flavobacteriales bacterium]|jgi:hypothetical protein|nr:hypothetical protein [Flavobacteriales bacterium]MBK9513998.1 hypothetical protein [Flavobacteriales bacterium]MBP7449608.1 hypothetical protein [Flavobacteriales bacterium]HOZ39940.1 hypothetical protein [Flavobacteriales bacterium]
MLRSTSLLLISGLLLGFLVLAADLAHQSMIDACVCVVNSAARASLSLAVSAAIGCILTLGSTISTKPTRVLEVFQVLSFIVALFFLVQHVFFVLQLA